MCSSCAKRTARRSAASVECAGVSRQTLEAQRLAPRAHARRRPRVDGGDDAPLDAHRARPARPHQARADDGRIVARHVRDEQRARRPRRASRAASRPPLIRESCARCAFSSPMASPLASPRALSSVSCAKRRAGHERLPPGSTRRPRSGTAARRPAATHPPIRSSRAPAASERSSGTGCALSRISTLRQADRAAASM